MSNWLKKALLIFTGTLVFVTLTAVGLAWYLQGRIMKQIVVTINDAVTVPVQVNGGIDLSLIRHFPYASLTFKNVVIDDKLQKGKKLLNVKEFSLLCNIFSLFKNKVELSKIYVKDGEVHLFTNEAGINNFDIFKPSRDTTKSPLKIQLKKAEINGVKFTYLDKFRSADIDIAVKKALLKGNFSSDNYDLETDLEATLNKISTSGQEFAVSRNVKAQIDMTVSNGGHRFVFKKGKLNIEDNEFSITGFLATLKKGTQLDFKLLNEGKDIRKLLALLPENFRARLRDAEGSGQYSVSATVKGMVSSTSTPQYNVSADFINAELRLSKYNKFLKKVNATAQYSMDEHGNDRLAISNFDCMLNDLPFNFKLTLTKLSNPDFDFYANGVLHVAELGVFVPDSVVHDLDGTITFNKFSLKGRKDDFSDVSNSTLSGSGDFKLNDVEFQAQGITYGNINGNLRYNDQLIDAENFTLNFLGNQSSFTGSINNLFAFIYNLSSKRNANNVVLGVNGKLQLKTLNLSGIIDAYNKKNRPQPAVPRHKIDVREIMNMQGNIDLQIDRFIFKQLEFDKLSANLQVAPGTIQCNNMQADAMDGNIRLDGRIKFGDDYSLNMAYDVKAVNLSLAKIFYECENFGQNTLTDKHLKGTISTSISFSAVWNNYSQLDPGSLNAIVDFDIRNGELIKFEPLKAASKFIRVDELQDIKFSNIANTIKIGDGRIDVPQFEIKSSALNLMFGGRHYFNNNIDYHLKINLHKLLAQKFNRRLANMDYMEDDPYEGLNLYLSMSGNLSNPVIKYDKANARKKMKDDFKKEKENFKNLLNNRAVSRGDENERKREDRYFDVKTEPQFMDFDSSDK